MSYEYNRLFDRAAADRSVAHCWLMLPVWYTEAAPGEYQPTKYAMERIRQGKKPKPRRTPKIKMAGSIIIEPVTTQAKHGGDTRTTMPRYRDEVRFRPIRRVSVDMFPAVLHGPCGHIFALDPAGQTFDGIATLLNLDLEAEEGVELYAESPEGFRRLLERRSARSEADAVET